VKNNELFHRINEAASRDIPDIIQRIDLANIEIKPVNEPLKKPHFWLQSTLAYSLSALVLFIGLLWAMTELSTDNVPNYTPLDTEAEIIGYQTLSSVSLLESSELIDLSFSLVPLSESLNEPLIASEIDTINSYINMLEITLGTQNQLTYVLTPSDQSQYQTMISFQGLSLTGEPISYRFYYNVSDTETERMVSGTISFLGQDYQAEGQISLEQQATIRSTFKVEIDSDNYVEIDDVSSSTNQQFNYRIVQNGALKNATNIKLNSQSNSLRAELSYQSNDKGIQIEIEKNQAQTGFTVRYRAADGIIENGSIVVDVEFDDQSESFRYRYRINDSSGQSQGQYHGNRKDKGQPTSGDEDPEDDDEQTPPVTNPGNQNPGQGPFS
jgi:hypothetical protein